MAAKTVLFLAIFALLFSSNTIRAARDTPTTKEQMAARLDQTGAPLVECWNALKVLKSCSNEIVVFFVTGDANIGANCCGAIELITRECWPAMIISLGFTPEEANVLRGFCDALSSSSSSPVPASPLASK